MNTLMNRLFHRLAPIQPLKPGIYHTAGDAAGASAPYRLHLRLEADGSGILMLNAATIIHLNQTAAEYAYHLVQGTTESLVAQTVAERYRIGQNQALSDYRHFTASLDTIIHQPDLEPVTDLGIDRHASLGGVITAPYRLDCALTYRLPEGQDAQAAPLKNVTRELATAEWELVIGKAWAAGIPHIVFTGGEPTLRPDLASLIGYAQKTGMVSGACTLGARLADPAYLETLLNAGLDHLLLVFTTDTPAIWAAIDNLARADLFFAVHLTVTPGSLLALTDTLTRLVDQQVKAFSLSASDSSLAPDMEALRSLGAARGLRLVWDLPVPYTELNPVAMETATEDNPPAGAGRAWLYVEPDGDVLPAQGQPKRLGNFLTDEWAAIWKTG